jgi:uncharacterized protein YhfF
MAIPVAAALARYPGAQTFRFGDTPELTAELLALVRTGKKRATCTALAEIGAAEVEPVPGRRDIALDAEGRAALAIETLRVVRLRFHEVTAEMALMEGEDDTLEGWRAGHRRYWGRQGRFAPDMEILWEEFRLVEDFAAAGAG